MKKMSKLTHIRLVLIVLCSIALCIPAHAQLKAPVQVDTLTIVSMKYNFNVVERENWPFDIVLRSMTEFRFGGEIAHIDHARESSYSSKYRTDGVEFRMTDYSYLQQYTIGGHVYIEYSGYELDCVIGSPQTRYKNCSVSANVSMKGRNVVGNISKPKCLVVEDGLIVIELIVDKSGDVTNAVVDESRTTVTDKDVLRDFCDSAKKIHFNMSPEAPKEQKGTVTFTLKVEP